MKKAILILLVGLFWCGNAYAGCIKGDCNNGQGTFTWTSGELAGSKYVGEYKDGKWHGQGTYTYASGTKYVGEFKNNSFHGHATVTFANGSKYVGEFINGEKGYGTFTTAKGNIYVGEHKNNKMHGQGTLTNNKGIVSVGEFKNGKYHGTHTVTFKDGVIVVAKFKNGKLKKVISSDTSARDKAKKKRELASMVEDAKKTCKDLGFTEGTDKFSDCSLKLYTLSVESAAKNNQTVVMQPQSSGSNSVTIYDPVRDSNALIRQGQRMLSGACTLGINC